MNDTNPYLDSREDQKILWSAKPILMKKTFKQAFTEVSIFEKIIVPVIFIYVIYSIYNLIVSDISFDFLILMTFLTVSVFGILAIRKYVEKSKFKHSKYTLTNDEIEIKSWSLLGGNQSTKIDLMHITTTHLLRIDKNIGTILLYCDEHHDRPRDFMSGAKLETVAIQYIDQPEEVKKLIDQQRINKS